jgi:hypothetical protein
VEVGFYEHALAPVAGGFGARHGRDDAGLVAGEDLGAAEVALVGDDVQIVTAERRLG